MRPTHYGEVSSGPASFPLFTNVLEEEFSEVVSHLCT
jgi:hypothetical protein